MFLPIVATFTPAVPTGGPARRGSVIYRAYMSEDSGTDIGDGVKNCKNMIIISLMGLADDDSPYIIPLLAHHAFHLLWHTRRLTIDYKTCTPIPPHALLIKVVLTASVSSLAGRTEGNLQR